MKNRPTPRIIALVAALVVTACLVIAPLSAWGDAGGFSGGSDYGGDSDWGSSSWDDDDDWSYSSWDDDDDDYWSYSWDDDDDDDWTYSDSSSGSGGAIGTSGSYSYDDDTDDWPLGLGILAVIVAAIVIYRAMHRRRVSNRPRTSSRPQPAGAQRTDRTMLHPISELQASDPAFSVPEMQEKISNIYVQLQQNWTAKDLEPMRPYLDDKLYATFDRQLDAYRNAGRTNRVDNIAVLGVNLDGWYQTSVNDCLVATVRTRIVDYDVDDRTGTVLSGSPTAEKFMTYEYTLIRSRGGQTRVQSGATEAVNCPNCGAPLNINRTSRCPYCDSIVTLDTFDWVVSQIKGLSQQTVG